MNAIWNRILSSNKGNRHNRRLLLWGLVILVIAIANCLHSTRPALQPVVNSDTETTADRPAAAETAVETVAQPAEPQPDNVVALEIQAGDTLSSIFDSASIGQPVLYQILAADEPLLALDVLHPGNRLTFTFHGTGRDLEKMELYIHPGRQVVYQRIDDDSFGYEEVEIPGVWEQHLVSGEIRGSFYQSAMDAGLREQDAGNIAELFKRKLNFSRDIRSGDQFQVVCRKQFVDGEPTGQSYIAAVRIFNQKETYTAYLFEDGNYYDQNGESLASAFLRYPFRGNHRITSPFSPKRKHPVTGRISPHNGTDFSMATGTQVLSTGDGVVSRVKTHPYAGKYIEIQHSGQYITRYLHLSSILVKKGQKVKRGELIAKSGNTGRSTGPHLHFELHVKGRPVDPVTAKIPLLAAVPENKRQEFDARCTALARLMDRPRRRVARSDAWAASADPG
jgi:murein DD-endopeptidase